MPEQDDYTGSFAAKELTSQLWGFLACTENLSQGSHDGGIACTQLRSGCRWYRLGPPTTGI